MWSLNVNTAHCSSLIYTLVRIVVDCDCRMLLVVPYADRVRTRQSHRTVPCKLFTVSFPVELINTLPYIGVVMACDWPVQSTSIDMSAFDGNSLWISANLLLTRRPKPIHAIRHTQRKMPTEASSIPSRYWASKWHGLCHLDHYEPVTAWCNLNAT